MSSGKLRYKACVFEPSDDRNGLLAVGALVLCAAVAVVPPAVVLWRAVACGLLGLVCALGWRRASEQVRAMLIVLLGVCVWLTLFPIWQLDMLLALLPLWVLPRSYRDALGGRLRLERGTVPVLATLGTALVTPVALVAWVLVFEPDLSDVVRNYVPDLAFPLLVAGAVGFAVVNALLEEIIWRQVIQGALARTFASPIVVVLLTALSFGVQHFYGVPRGPMGVLMVTTWGIMLSALRRSCGGLLAPVLAHVVADSVIAAIIFVLYL